MKALIKVAVVFLGFSTQAFATGGTHCLADYGDIKVEVSLINGRVPGAPVLSNSSAVTVEKKGLETIEFDLETELVGWWSVDGEVKMLLWQNTDKGDAILKVTVKYTDVHETYLGTFEYTAPDGSKQIEILSCDVE